MEPQVGAAVGTTFAKLRELLITHKDLKSRIDDLEKKYDQQFQVVFKAVKLLLDEKPKKGFGGKRFEAE